VCEIEITVTIMYSQPVYDRRALYKLPLR